MMFLSIGMEKQSVCAFFVNLGNKMGNKIMKIVRNTLFDIHLNMFCLETYKNKMWIHIL